MENTETEAKSVYKTYSRTQYGKKLAKRARYDRFRPKDYSVKHWERLLGTDVNNLHHMRQSMRVAQWFIRHENAIKPHTFSRREALLLTVTGALHDQAEAVIGDIPYGRKSEYTYNKEKHVLKEYESAFAPRIKGPALILYRYGRDRIAFNRSAQKLPSAFKTVELLGFMRNAVMASQRAREINEATMSSAGAAYLGIQTSLQRTKVVTALERLLAEVLGSGVLGQLINLSARYPSIVEFLQRHRSEITHGFASIKEDTFDWYESGEDVDASHGEKQHRMWQFKDQEKTWQEFVNREN